MDMGTLRTRSFSYVTELETRKRFSEERFVVKEGSGVYSGGDDEN
jgi:hypothetical protein